MKRAYGFTIVELLIVIVVIAILAALSYVGYANITQRAENNQNIVAMEGYLKAVSLYKADKGDIPRTADGSCLGKNYPWELEGVSSGMNQCRWASIPYYTESKATALNAALSEYVSPLPQPNMKAIGAPTAWRRGIAYITYNGELMLSMALQGTVTCPVLAGIAPLTSPDSVAGGTGCTYSLGP